MTVKVLLAEDDIDDQFFFKDYLESRNDIEILPIANNGEELIEYLENIGDSGLYPDAIILDQNMPKCTGLQTLQYIKNAPKYSQIMVMVYSTYADDNLVRQSMEMGAATVIMKPTNAKGYNLLIDSLVKLVVPTV